MITASYAFLPHIRASVVIIFKSLGYITEHLSPVGEPFICISRDYSKAT
ncbi:hypothetical protein [Symbiopectobacterium sp. RP]